MLLRSVLICEKRCCCLLGVAGAVGIVALTQEEPWFAPSDCIETGFPMFTDGLGNSYLRIGNIVAVRCCHLLLIKSVVTGDVIERCKIERDVKATEGT